MILWGNVFIKQHMLETALKDIKDIMDIKDRV